MLHIHLNWWRFVVGHKDIIMLINKLTIRNKLVQQKCRFSFFESLTVAYSQLYFYTKFLERSDNSLKAIIDT